MKKLGELVKIYDGTHQTPNYVPKGIPFYSVEQVTANQFEKTKFVTLEVFEKENKRVKLEKGDILMTRIGSIGVAKYIDWDVNASFYVSLALIKQSNKINNEYLCHFINTNFFQSELWKKTIHVAFPQKINLGEIGECFIKYPLLLEQQKISSLLSLIDERILKSMKIIRNLETLMNEFREKIFSQQFRFKDDLGNNFPTWQLEKLGDIGIFFSGGTPLTSIKSYYNGNIPFIKSGEINSSTTAQFISQEALKKSSAKMVNVGDLIYALYGATSGEVGLSKIDGAINQAILCIRTPLNNFYLLNYLKLKKENILKTYLQGGQGNLSADIVKSLIIPVPASDEQTKIAQFLFSLDNKINLEKELLVQFENQKKYLLANLFV